MYNDAWSTLSPRVKNYNKKASCNSFSFNNFRFMLGPSNAFHANCNSQSKAKKTL